MLVSHIFKCQSVLLLLSDTRLLHVVVYFSSGIRKDELQAAIELSLQESHNAQEEEREFHRCFFTFCLWFDLS